MARNAAGTWLQLADDSWILAELVANVPDLPVSKASPPTAAQAPPTNASHATQTSILTVHFIDVGQGDSEFIQTSDGHNILIDAGNPGKGVLAYLKAQGVTDSNLVVFSHPHSDHIGGLPEVIQACPSRRWRLRASPILLPAAAQNESDMA